MDVDVKNNVEDVPEDVHEETVGDQTLRSRDLEQEEVPNMLDEVASHGADLAGGESKIPLAIIRVTDPVIRREVRNAHYRSPNETPMQKRSPSEARAKPERSRGLRKEHGTPKGRSGSRNYIIPRPQNLPALLGGSMLLKLIKLL